MKMFCWVFGHRYLSYKRHALDESGDTLDVCQRCGNRILKIKNINEVYL